MDRFTKITAFGLLTIMLLCVAAYVSGADNNIGNQISTALKRGSKWALQVQIIDDLGDTITSLGAGTEMTEVAENTDRTADVLEAFPPGFSSQVAIAISSSGNNELIAAVSGQVIDIQGCVLVARGTVESQFISGDTGGALANEVNMSGPILLGVAGTNPPGFVTNINMFVPAGKAFGIELSAAVEVDGYCTYVQYTPS